MHSRRYVICDIEATGLHEDKDLIEIALITFQDEKITEVYETLINPEVPVSSFVRGLTGISQRELEQAPKFHEVAESIRLRIEGSTFVSHNTDFDFGLLQKKFRERGEELRAKTSCTLRMAEELIPGLLNYNLDALSSFFGIKIRDRHRAAGDALATLEIFRELQKLRTHTRSVPLWLPHQEKLLKNLPKKAGLLQLLDKEGMLLRVEATADVEKRGRALLEVKPENRQFLLRSSDVQYVLTGSALIAEFELLRTRPVHYHWTVSLESDERGEQRFVMKPHRKGAGGIWYFSAQLPARKKCQDLNFKLVDRKLIYQEGGKSKEEILRSNQKAAELSRSELFPTPNLIIIGEGRTLRERSFILIRDDHVKGYGHSEAPEEEILLNPEAHLTRLFNINPGLDVAARRYIRILKNLRQKTERWQGLSAKTVVEGTHERKTL